MRHGDHRLLLGRRSSPAREFQTPASQVTVLAERAQDLLCALDQQAAQIPVSCLGEPYATAFCAAMVVLLGILPGAFLGSVF